MKQNLWLLDRILRFALAFWFLGPWALRTGNIALDGVIIVVGIIALVESFVSFCWLHELFKINNKNH